MINERVSRGDITNLDEIINLIVSEIKEHDEALKSVKEHGIPHMTGGMYIRNRFDLWWNDKNKRFDKDPEGKPPLIQWFNERDIYMGDDLSMIISNAVQANLKGEDYNIDADIKEIKDHWAEQGFKDGIYNPLKMKR